MIHNVVDVAQLVEPRFVVPVVVGSSPIVHPTEKPQTNRTHRNIADRLGRISEDNFLSERQMCSLAD